MIRYNNRTLNIPAGLSPNVTMVEYATQTYVDAKDASVMNWVEAQGYAGPEELTGKQDTLVSGENIKTINGESILGEGNIVIQGGSGSVNDVKVNGESVVTEGVANITIPEPQDASVKDVKVNGASVVSEGVASIDLSGYALDSSVVHLTIDEFVSGIKTVPEIDFKMSADQTHPAAKITGAVNGDYTTYGSELRIDASYMEIHADLGCGILGGVGGIITNKVLMGHDKEIVIEDGSIAITADTMKFNGKDVATTDQIPSVPVQDVKVNGSSVLTDGVASISVPSVPVQDVLVNWSSVLSSEGKAIVTVPVEDVTVDGESVLNGTTAEITLPDVPVQDVTVNGESVLNGTTAEITIPDIPENIVSDVKVDGSSVVSEGVASIDLTSYAKANDVISKSDGGNQTVEGSVSFHRGVITDAMVEVTNTAGTAKLDVQSWGLSRTSGGKQGNLNVPLRQGYFVTSPYDIAIWKGTQAEYDAITTYDASTLYFIVS